MSFEKQILGVLANEYGPEPGNSVVLAGDVDGDGWLDIIVCGRNGRMAWLRNGQAYDRCERYFIDEQVRSRGCGAALCDLTGNGRPDIVVGGGEDSDEVLWYENPGDPTQLWPRHLAFSTGKNNINDLLVVENLMGDGKTGLLLTCLEGGTRLLYLPIPQDPKAPWPQPTVLCDGLVEENFDAVGGESPEQGLAVGDLNGDGKLEIVLGTNWFQRQDEGFIRHKFCEGYVGTVLALADLNGDGKLEIALAEGDARALGKEGGGRVAVFSAPQDLNAYWNENVLLEDALDPHALCVGDFLGNGVPCLVVGEAGAPDRSRFAYAGGALPRILLYTWSDGAYRPQAVDVGTGLYRCVPADIHHKGTAVVGAPLYGNERWAIHAYALNR